jgi:hypothetical protein
VSEEEGVIEASAWTAVEQEEAGGGEVVVAGAVKVLDVLLLVLEALVLDIIPKFLKGAQVAGARAMDAVQVSGGGTTADGRAWSTEGASGPTVMPCCF